MSSNIRPEIQRFCAAMNLLTAEVERETKTAAEKNKKAEVEVAELMRTIKLKEAQLEALENECSDIEAEQQCLIGPLQEYQELEEKYQQIHKKESAKLEAASRRRKELVASQTNKGMQDFNKLQEELNNKLQSMSFSKRNSQDPGISKDEKLLEDTVYDLQREVNELQKQTIEKKKAWNKRQENVYGTDKEHRDMAAGTLNDFTQRLRKEYINSKLQLHKLKIKHRKL